MTEKIKNLPASVMDRLRHKARISNQTFNWVLKNYLNERFLYRLAQSPHCSKFVLKGGLIFSGWRTPLRRHTKDIDLRGYTQNTEANISQIIMDICNQTVEPDGVQFDPDTIATEIITEQADYP
jgi:predicted nucleotidyltransferase component of viral defense system